VRERLLGAKRAGAEDYLLLTVVAFALTVVATRWYLEFSGYPKVGGGGLHVAHMLWGGLLLIVGALLPMLFVGRRVMQLSAIATGVGVGLFIDEVGKFITESNDYFFAPAAPLIYGGVLLLMLLWVMVRRRSGGTPHDAVQAAIEALRDGADGRLTADDRDVATERLRAVRSDLPPTEDALAGRIAGLLESPEVDATLASAGWVSRGSARVLLERLLPTRLERVFIIIGLGFATFLAVGTTVFVLTFDIDALVTIFPDTTGPVENPTDPFWWLLLGGTAILVGIVSAIAVVALLRGDARRGATIGMAAMLIHLVATGLLTFYVAQFEAVASTVVRVILLALILDFRGRLDRADPGMDASTPPPSEPTGERHAASP
jgi:hypothetical protein